MMYNNSASFIMTIILTKRFQTLGNLPETESNTQKTENAALFE